MSLQAYVDDSYQADGFYVLGGVISTPERWASFSAEWAKMLPRFGTLRKDNTGYHFKFNEMRALDERNERIPLFMRVIEEHAIAAFSVAFRPIDLENAKKKIIVEDFNWGEFDLDFMFAYSVLMQGFSLERDQIKHIIPDNVPVDFIFDEQTEKKYVLDGWNYYRSKMRNSDKYLIGNPPRFEDDNNYVQLQAADLIAGLQRTIITTSSYVSMGKHKIWLNPEYFPLEIKTPENKGAQSKLNTFHMLLSEEDVLNYVIYMVDSFLKDEGRLGGLSST